MESKKRDELRSIGMRCTKDTPPFFKKLRTIGLIVAAVGTSIVSAPISMPAAAITIGGYLIFGGTVMTAVSQSAVNEKDCED